MTNQERLDKFKTLYRCKEEYTMSVGITGEDKLKGSNRVPGD